MALWPPSQDHPGIPLSGTSMQTEGYLYLTIRNGGAIMPSYYWAMNDAEMWDVVAYLRSLFPAPCSGRRGRGINHERTI